MISEKRSHFNALFTEEKYNQFIEKLDSKFNYKIPFRVAETPVFVSTEFKNKLVLAGNEIIQSILSPSFKQDTEKAIPPGLKVPNEDEHATILAIDFAVCKEGDELVPQLIELQGFPSLFAWEPFLTKNYKEVYGLADNLTPFLSGLSEETYWNKFSNLVLGSHKAENVILLEIEPYEQGTAIDFFLTKEKLGIEIVCITEIIRREKKLFYLKNGIEVEVKRIYNRIIFDEFTKRTDLKCQFHLTEDVDVEWVCHPNWFFRISKFIMPFLKSAYVPECKLLIDYKTFPTDLENYVLKPLFSFSGTGVVFNVKQADIDAVPKEEYSNYMLQRKIKYEPVLDVGDEKVKVEIRMLYFWEPNSPLPEPVINLTRLSKGEMIGVKYNKDKTFVGGTVSLFES